METLTLASKPPQLPLHPAREEAPSSGSSAVLVCGLDSTKLTFGEWWLVAPGLSAVIGWISKIFRASLLEDARFLVVRDSAALQIPSTELDEAANKMLLPQAEALRQLGFGEPFFMRVTDVFTNRETLLMMQLHASGMALSRVTCVRPLAGATSKKKVLSLGFLTQLSNGRFLCTDDKRPKFLSAPAVLAQWKRGSHAARWEAHWEIIEQLQVAPVLADDSGEGWRMCDRYEKAIFDFRHERGVYVTLADKDGAKVLSIVSPE